MRLKPEEWATWFTGPKFTRSAWRWEAQPVYRIDAEAPRIALWRAGAARPENHNAAWRDGIRALTATGRTISRVRVIDCPPTEYQRYQLAWGIPANTEAGETYRLWDLAVTPLPQGLERRDFWLFDDAQVVEIAFTPQGRLIGPDLVEDPDLDAYRWVRDCAVRCSVPYRPHGE